MTFKVLLSTTVWGEEYIEIFLEYTIKSLLTKDNLKNKKISNKSEYLIFTKKKYFKSIQNHSNFKNLKKIINVNLKELSFSKNEGKYLSLKNNQNISIKYGYKKHFDYFSFIYPDSIFGENHFKTILEKVEKGAKVVLCPGPLGIYERFVTIFKKKKLNNKNISNFILKNIHPFYKVFMDNNQKNRIKIYENNKNNCQIYKGYDLHVALISFSIMGLKITNSYDEDLLNNKNISFKDLDYINHSSQGIIITLESNFSERAMLYDAIQNVPKLKNINDNIYDIIKFCDKDFFGFHVNNFIRGTFIVSEKKLSINIKKIHPSLINLLKKIMRHNEIKFNNKKNIINQFLNFKIIHKNFKENFSNKLDAQMDNEIKKQYEKEQLKIENDRKKFEDELFKIRKKELFKIRKKEQLKIRNDRKKFEDELFKIRKKEKNNFYACKKIKGIIVSKKIDFSQETPPLLRLKIEEEMDFVKTINIVRDINYIKLSTLALITIIYRTLPIILIKFLNRKKIKIKSSLSVSNNFNVLKFLLMLPRRTILKLLIKRLNK